MHIKPESFPLDFQSAPNGDAPVAGDHVGKLRIVEHIASGGMADVYKALHLELEVIRAVKILKPEHTQEDKARFQTEAKISAHLRHPNIVQIFSVDEWKNSLPYIEMEYVDGTSLYQLILEHRRLPCDFSTALCAIVCAALEYAQKQTLTVYGKAYTGLVHRDIKPANILLAKDGTVKLADFGIAIPGNVSIHTVGPNTMGTYAYLSPEQLDGLPLDQRSDIYSLGTVLYEMMTGSKAFGDSALSELIKNKMRGTYRPLQSLVPNIPKSLVRLVDRSIALDRKKRFADVAEFSKALRQVLGGLSDSQPTVVVGRYLSSPKRDAATHTKPRSSFLGGDRLVPALAGGAVLAFVIAAMLIKTSLRPPLQTPPSAQTESATLSTPAQKANQPGALPANADLAQSAMSQEPRAQSAASERVIPYSLNPFAAGLAAFKSRKYGAAIAQLEKALQDNPTARQAVLAHLRLFDAYVRTGNSVKALIFAQGPLVDDGYYYLLCGEAYFLSGGSDAAEEALSKAQVTRSTLAPDVRRDATYYWVKNRLAIYAKKPNVDNKQTAIRAWQNFAQAFCKNQKNDSLCFEAQAEVEKLEK